MNERVATAELVEALRTTTAYRHRARPDRSIGDGLEVSYERLI